MTSTREISDKATDIIGWTNAITASPAVGDPGGWDVWDAAGDWWGTVDAAVLDELAGNVDEYGVTVTRRSDGGDWIVGLAALPTQLVRIAHDGLQLATATVDTDLPDSVIGVCLSPELDARATVNALLFWQEEMTVHNSTFGSRPNSEGFVRLNLRGALADGTRLVVSGLFHAAIAPNAVRIIEEEIEGQDVRSLLFHLFACDSARTCSHSRPAVRS